MKLASVQPSAQSILSASLAVAATLWCNPSHAIRPGGPFHLDVPETTNFAKINVRATRINEYDRFSNPVTLGSGRHSQRGFASISSPTADEQETDDRNEACDERNGNPVVLYTGNKVEHEQDFVSNGEMGLYLQRTYNHRWSAAGVFGNHWISNLDYTLAFSAGDALAWAQRPDGRRIKFTRDGDSGTWFEDKPEPVAYLIRNADGGHTLFNEDRGTETYNADGYIVQRRNEQGVAWQFEYQDMRLRTVTHSSGRRMMLEWDDSVVAQVTDPDGGVYRYTYAANALGNGTRLLASTTLPGSPGTTLAYHYEDPRFPGALTGKSFNGTRYSAFGYDLDGRAILTEHAGGVERHTFNYEVLSTEPVAAPPSPPAPGGGKGDTETGWCEYRPGHGPICFHPSALPGGPGTVPMLTGGVQAAAPAATRTRPVQMRVTSTNPLGRRTVYLYEDGRQVSVTGDASPRCAASYRERSYDPNGYPDLFHDFANNLTDFDYTAQGRLIRQVEAVGSSAERTTTYRWNADGNRLLATTVQGDHEASYTYDAKGNIASATVRNLGSHGVAGQARTTHYTYAYHANGLKASVRIDGPLAQDDVTSFHNDSGDLVRVTNGLGHTTQYSGHNGLGLPNRVTGPNGETSTYRYDKRGRVVAEAHLAGSGTAATTYTYNGTGDVASITLPDGVVVRYEYDAARRLMNQTKPLGDGTYAWTRRSYDNASNLVKIEVAQGDYGMDSQVTGRIDAVSHDDRWNWHVSGWACSSGSSTSIGVRAYANGQALVGGVANLASEPAVAAACQASGTAYRFKLPISLQQRQAFGGQAIVVYGLSPRGGAHNRPLDNATGLSIPFARLVGEVANVAHDAQWNYYVNGWACSVGLNQPTTVQLYAGGPPGVGTHLADATGEFVSNPGVRAACQSDGAYGFSMPLDAATRMAHGGRAIHIVGLSPAGNRELSRSGTHTVPTYLRSAELVGFSPSPEHILNGDISMLTAVFRNTGNVMWTTAHHLAWGETALTDTVGLDGAVVPGGIATFTWSVQPINRGPAVKRIPFVARLAENGAVWGPLATTRVLVENQYGYCPPVGPCHHPISIEQPIPAATAEGDR